MVTPNRDEGQTRPALGPGIPLENSTSRPQIDNRVIDPALIMFGVNRLASRLLAMLLVTGMAPAAVADPSADDALSLGALANSGIIRQLPDIEINDASVYFPLNDGHYEYDVFDYSSHTLSHDAENQRLIQTGAHTPRWQREANNHITEEWQRSDAGHYELRTPAGTFPAILLSEEYSARIGLLDIHSKRYRFYSAHIGKVAEIEGLRVTGPFLYKSENRLAKVLVSYPGSRKS